MKVEQSGDRLDPTNERRRIPMTRTTQTNLGDLISLFYEEFMEMYGDAELASVAAAAVINDLLSDEGPDEIILEDAA
jgi:hypothetical protein